MKKMIGMVSLLLLPSAAFASRAIVICQTDRPGWTYELDGVGNEIQSLVLHHQVIGADGAPQTIDYLFDTRRKDQFNYDGRTLDIFPDAATFPSGFRLIGTECFA